MRLSEGTPQIKFGAVYGIWSTLEKEWVTDSEFLIFSTPSQDVAKAQLDILTKAGYADLEVKAFGE